MRGLKLSRPAVRSNSRKSHPTRVRGLKLHEKFVLKKMECVAPYTGAWIEITGSMGDSNQVQSHPTRVRGLKFAGEERTWVKDCRTLHGCVD